MSRHHCEFRFYGELNDFLRPLLRRRTVVHVFDGTPSVKDRIEAFGVPHTEVDLILVDGGVVGFGRRLCGGERVAVYPTFQAFDGLPRLRPPPPERFVLDVHLGALARYLRLLGIDCAYTNDAPDDVLVALSRTEYRVLLTRDVGLLRRSAVVHGGFVHETDPRRQLREVLDRFRLADRLAPLTRCARCNGILEAATPARGDVPESVRGEQVRFRRCPDCDRFYWPGGHVTRLRGRLAEVGVWI
ncbi:Mut7-C RNAse domain-containing protein [Prescottella subtropica]|uniref:Mut7-C RNAse domain-containing protein n=1 Tax=Prescottella subtropica TaxID=2545757 RepID=UPI0010F52DAD|nr:Mut7-C RNAse domain-containing protein [Prescottella subtropica]